MPVLESSKRALRTAQQRAAVNILVRRHYKEILKEASKEPTKENLKKAYSAIDKAAKDNVIHKNKAARLKSRLAKLLNKKAPVETKPVKKLVKRTVRKPAKKTVKETKTRKSLIKKV